MGSSLAGNIVEHIGPKKSLIFNCIVATIGLLFLLTKMKNHFETFLFGRLIIGVNTGVNSGVCTVYCWDVSPKNSKRLMGFMYELWVAISFLLAMSVGVESIMGNDELWLYYMVVPGIIMAVLQFGFLIMAVPESPKFLLVIKNKKEAAVTALSQLRVSVVEVEKEILEMEEKMLQNMKRVVYLRNFIKKLLLRKTLCIILFVIFFQQVSGINVLLFCSGDIFSSYMEYQKNEVEQANIGLAFMNIVAVIASYYIIPKACRKLLLLVSFGGLVGVICLLLFFIQKLPYLTNMIMYFYIIMYRIGAGCVPPVLAWEMFEPHNRLMALTCMNTFSWLVGFFVIFTYILIQVSP